MPPLRAIAPPESPVPAPRTTKRSLKASSKAHNSATSARAAGKTITREIRTTDVVLGENQVYRLGTAPPFGQAAQDKRSRISCCGGASASVCCGSMISIHYSPPTNLGGVQRASVQSVPEG